ncbi:hypothetical protein [Allokutzneria oryzae]|uniref:Anti-sigma factor n=1 Tax=Allokutzneria oryzae TaxID=1378989 RepID=A0ABV6A5N3_9PSEU
MDDKGNDAFEGHLTRCAACQREVVGIVPIAALLRQADRLGLFAPPAPRARRGVGFPVGIAACALLLVVAALFGSEPPMKIGVPEVVTSPDSLVQPVAKVGERLLTGENPRTSAVLRVTTRLADWGTEVDVDVTGVQGPCELVAYSVANDPQVTLGWTASGARQSQRLKGSVGLHPDEITGFGVRAPDGTLLVTTH